MNLNIPAAVNASEFCRLPDTPFATANEARLHAALEELLDAQAALSTCATKSVPAAIARHMEAIKAGRDLVKELK